MSTAHRCLKSPQSLSGTSAHPTMVTLVNIMVMNGWLTSFSFHVNRPSHSWDKAISDSDLDISTPRWRSWVWSKGKVIQSAQYHIKSLRLHSHQSDQNFLRESYFEIWPWNIQGQGYEWGQRSRSHIVPSIQPNQCTSFSFHINPTNHSWDMAKIVFVLESTHPKFLKKICQNESFIENLSKI